MFASGRKRPSVQRPPFGLAQRKNTYWLPRFIILSPAPNSQALPNAGGSSTVWSAHARLTFAPAARQRAARVSGLVQARA